MPKNNNILQLSKDFRQANSKKDKYPNFFISKKSSPKLLSNIILANHSIVKTKNLSNMK